MIALMVAAGAVAGAPARYLTDRLIQQRHESVFPWGTLAVNVTACLVLGMVAAAAERLPPSVVALIATGFCGALSTYGTFSYETVLLVQDGDRFRAAAYVGLSVVVGIGAAASGWALGGLL